MDLNKIKGRIINGSIPEPNTGCWLWTMSITKSGYGKLVVKNGIKKQRISAHRMSYESFRGNIGNLCVLHKCDTRSCVNPDHLFLGTKSDNSVDMIQKGRGNDCRGERSANSILTDSLVLEIRHKYHFDKIPAKRLAREYRLNISTVRSFLKRRSWNHI